MSDENLSAERVMWARGHAGAPKRAHAAVHTGRVPQGAARELPAWCPYPYSSSHRPGRTRECLTVPIVLSCHTEASVEQLVICVGVWLV